MNKILEFNNINKKYGDIKVLTNTSLSIREGEIVCLLGPSGSGKTTLFRMAAELTEPDRGNFYVKSGIRKGFSFQEPRLLPWKTVADNIRLVQRNFLAGKEARIIRNQLLKLTGLASFKNNYPQELSGGMKQRVEIIRALSIKPDILFLDEPFKSVDTQTKVNLRRMILRLWERWNFSVFHITHDPEEAVLMADRIYVLSDKPARIVKEFKLEKPQHLRSLKDEQIFSIREEIINLFMDLVEGFHWKKDEETEEVFKEI